MQSLWQRATTERNANTLLISWSLAAYRDPCVSFAARIRGWRSGRSFRHPIADRYYRQRVWPLNPIARPRIDFERPFARLVDYLEVPHAAW